MKKMILKWCWQVSHHRHPSFSPNADDIYSGSSNKLIYAREETLKIMCYYDLRMYPFDVQECLFTLSIQDMSNKFGRFVEVNLIDICVYILHGYFCCVWFLLLLFFIIISNCLNINIEHSKSFQLHRRTLSPRRRSLCCKSKKMLTVCSKV